eukprot:UN28346
MLNIVLNTRSREDYNQMVDDLLNQDLQSNYNPRRPSLWRDSIVKGIKLFPDITARLLKHLSYFKSSREFLYPCTHPKMRLIGGSSASHKINYLEWGASVNDKKHKPITCRTAVSPIEGLASEDMFVLLK